jgi:hypothetical protein
LCYKNSGNYIPFLHIKGNLMGSCLALLGNNNTDTYSYKKKQNTGVNVPRLTKFYDKIVEHKAGKVNYTEDPEFLNRLEMKYDGNEILQFFLSLNQDNIFKDTNTQQQASQNLPETNTSFALNSNSNISGGMNMNTLNNENFEVATSSAPLNESFERTTLEDFEKKKKRYDDKYQKTNDTTNFADNSQNSKIFTREELETSLNNKTSMEYDDKLEFILNNLHIKKHDSNTFGGAGNNDKRFTYNPTMITKKVNNNQKSDIFDKEITSEIIGKITEKF